MNRILLVPTVRKTATTGMNHPSHLAGLRWSGTAGAGDKGPPTEAARVPAQDLCPSAEAANPPCTLAGIAEGKRSAAVLLSTFGGQPGTRTITLTGVGTLP